jgi:hypothetical protein
MGAMLGGRNTPRDLLEHHPIDFGRMMPARDRGPPTVRRKPARRLRAGHLSCGKMTGK